MKNKVGHVSVSKSRRRRHRLPRTLRKSKSHLQGFPTMQWMRKRMHNVQRDHGEKLTPAFLRHAAKIFRSLGQNPIIFPLDARKGRNTDPEVVVTKAMLEKAVAKQLGSEGPEAAALLVAMDLDKKAKINYNEFVRALAKVQQKDYYKLDTQKSADKWKSVFTKLSFHANRQEILEKIKIAKEKRKQVQSVRGSSRLDKLDFDNLMDLFNASMTGSIFDIPSKRRLDEHKASANFSHNSQRKNTFKASDAAIYQVHVAPPSSWQDPNLPATSTSRQSRALYNVRRRTVQSQFSKPAAQMSRRALSLSRRAKPANMKDPLRFSQSNIPVLGSTKRDLDLRRRARSDVSVLLGSIKRR